MDKRAVIDDLRASITLLEEGGLANTESKMGELRSRPDPAPSLCNISGSADCDDRATFDAQHCFSQAVSSLKASDQPSSKIRKKLRAKGYDEVTVEQTISRLLSLGYLDDDRYAENYLRSRYAQGKGIPGILRELRSAEIDVDSLAGIIDDLTSEQPSERQRAYEFIVTHPPRSKNKREGAYRKLITRGYSSDAASYAARRWSSEQDNF